MKITPDDIRSAYVKTHYHANGLDLDVIFEQGYQDKNNAWGGRFDLVCYLCENMRHLNLDSSVLLADGGIRDFMIWYYWGNYAILLARSYSDFNSVQNFCDWLNNHIELIELNTRAGGVLKR